MAEPSGPEREELSRLMQAPASHGATARQWQPRPAVLRLRSVACLVIIDLLAILAGFGGTIAARNALHGATDWLFVLATLVPLYLLIAINNHAYASANLRQRLRVVRRGLRALTAATATTVLVGFSLKTSDSVPRLVALFGFATSGLLMAAGRYLFARHFRAILGGDPFSVILIREADQPTPDGGFSLVIVADAGLDPEARDAVMYDRLARTLQACDRVVIACRPERREAWTHVLKGNSVQGEIVMPELSPLAPLAIGACGEQATVVVSAGPLEFADRAIKRCFDVVVAGAALLVLSPLLLAVALAVRLDSAGPALFRQTRLGLDNAMFRMLKFRSMRVEQADGDGHRSTARDDDRITRVGRFIRRTSLDELPQLLNVLVGDMSIVGPRPHALGSRAADKLFWEVDARYWHRHAVKPGLTGLAQVRGFRGATLAEADLANRLQADLEYLENWSIWRDVKIIAMTFRVILHRNAF